MKTFFEYVTTPGRPASTRPASRGRPSEARRRARRTALSDTDGGRSEPVLTRPTVGAGSDSAHPALGSRGGCVRMVVMQIVVLAGGIGGARFLTGVRTVARERGAEVTAVVNVGDDVTLHGLRICPDLDSVMYTLGGGADRDRGWGRAGESWVVKEELAAYGAEPAWFGLGDKDLATHLVRTRMLDAGYPLSAVTEALCARWQPGIRMLPATDDRLETHVVTGGRALHFQEWWIRYRAELPAERFVFVGAEAAKPAAGVLDALADADLVLVAPSNPVVSVAPILAVA